MTVEESPAPAEHVVDPGPTATTLITHEWLARAGGSENVFEQLGAAFPDADQYCLWNEDPARFPRARETWLSRTPLRRSKAAALPFLRSGLRSVPVEDYEVVVASSHAFGHYNAYRAVRHGGRGFAYVHSPARYVWAPDHDVRGQSRAVRSVAPLMRHLDRRTVSTDVHYAANSAFVRDRIRTAWGVDADVIHPPVAVDEITATLATPLDDRDAEVVDGLPEGYLLGASRLVGYKRVDQVVELAAALGRPVVVAGEGPEEPALRDLATRRGVHAVFVGRVSDRLLYELYRRAALFVLLAVEDFGIMPLEAVAAGAPVLVNHDGGAWEGVGGTGAGERTRAEDPRMVVEAARRATARKDAAGPDAVRAFSHPVFRRTVREWVEHG